jgi:hypothetical protein
MAWIESHDELPTHPKTLKAARRLQVSVPQVIGHLHVLWYWCLTHRPDGRLEGMDFDDVADAAGWADEGQPFVTALLTSGWLDDDAGTLVVHDWWEGAGKTIKRRKYATSRQRRARESQSADGQVTEESRDSHGDVTRDTSVSHGADSDRDRDKKNPSSDVPSDPEVSPEARELTRHLAVKVQANGFKVPDRGQKAHADWLVAMDRLLRLDEADPVEVRRVIDWSTADPFWQTNVRSAPKFRDQFPSLRLRMLNEGKPVEPKRRQDAVAARFGEAAR